MDSASITTAQSNRLSQIIELMEKRLSEIQALDSQIHASLQIDEIEAAITSSADLNDQIFINIDTIKRFLHNFNQTAESTGVSTSASSHTMNSNANRNNTRLPKLNLPTFSGNYKNWTSFFDLFTSSVDSNSTLTNSQKLQYLKASLTADAAKLLSSFTVTDNNYETALDVLKKRYNNPRMIARAHVQSIFDLPKMRNDNGNDLRKLIEGIEEHRLSLQTLGLPVEHYDLFLIFLVTERLDLETRRQWEIASPGTSLQTYEALKTFIETRCNALEASTPSPKQFYSEHKNQSQQNSQQHNQSYAGTQSIETCLCCGQEHRLYTCPKYNGLTIDEKTDFIKEKRLCFNCLRYGHRLQDCSSASKCKECNRSHHTTLHRQKKDFKANSATVEAQETDETIVTSHSATSSKQVILPTAVVQVQGKHGIVSLRALLDSGSQTSFITDDASQKLQLPKQRNSITVSALGGKTSTCSGTIDIQIHNSSVNPLRVTAFVLPKLTQNIPMQNIDISLFDNHCNFVYADPQFQTPGRIDLILGADVFEEVFLERKVELSKGLALRETIFGWVVIGQTQCKSSYQVQAFHCLDTSLQKFWELENVPQVSKHTDEELACEQHFLDTTTRDKGGRFFVKLPFKENESNLGDSLQNAKRRFLSLEKRLSKLPEIKQQYTDFINEFLALGHMEVVPENEIDIKPSKSFYLPHHFVTKADSTTTKLRVVFDASAKTTLNNSLNSNLMIGPKLQSDLFDILLRLRFHKFVLSADIAKMYRQVALHKPDRDFHRVLWREKDTDPIQHLRMTRVTYGVTSSSFHSIRSLLELAKTAPEKVRRIIENDMYVDDLLTGCSNIEEAKDLQDQLIETLQTGGFPLRKWTSNSPELIKRLPETLRETKDDITFQDEEYKIKALGIVWRPNPDSFVFTVKLADKPPITKRGVLSEITSLFDPLGCFSPVLVKFKCFIQDLWKLKLGWDQSLPPLILQEWLLLRQSLSAIKNFSIARCLLPERQTSVQHVELHMFSDASEKAYGAAIYAVCRCDDTKSCHLIASKTRVAPVKSLSVPRLELCAAVLGVNLLETVHRVLVILFNDRLSLNGWTDSTIVLSWLSKPASSWQTFIRYRISKIQSFLPFEKWNHVVGEENPADICSRGVPADKIADMSLWWHGPSWLSEKSSWPHSPITPAGIFSNQTDEAIISTCQTSHLQSNFAFLDFDRFTSFRKMVRVFCYILRFLNLIKTKQRGHYIPNVPDIHSASIKLLQLIQSNDLKDEIALLQSQDILPNSNSYKNLAPFLDPATKLVRVGGRLTQGDFSELKKHPVLISKDSIIAKMLIADAHFDTLHGGVDLVLNTIRQKYWIVAAKPLIKSYIKNCVTCSRFTCTEPFRLMGDLPVERISTVRAFNDIGMDFTGPFLVRFSPTVKDPVKVYVCLFVCMSTKACHLEVVTSLHEEACLAAIARFCARRGRPTKIFSDNATKFLASRTDLDNTFEIDAFNRHMKQNLSAKAIEWLVIPVHAPHFGGLWETSIKSMKHHLRKVMKKHILLIEHFTTLITQIECMLNSRPLTALSTDPNDLSALTPGHFLIGSPINLIPDLNSKKTIRLGNLRDFQQMQTIRNQFWKEWHRNYITSLQVRKKWLNDSNSFNIGDLVLVAEDNCRVLDWPLARITKLFKGNDTRTRVVEVETAKWVSNRPIVKLRKLPL